MSTSANPSMIEWSHVGVCWLVRFLVEKGIEEVDAVVILMRGRGFHRSVEDIRIAAESSYRRFLQAARSLQVSCPRWWSALDLGTPVKVAKGCMIRRAEMEEVAEDEEAEVLDDLREVDNLDALFVPKELPKSEPVFTAWLITDMPSAEPWRVGEMVSTKSAIGHRSVRAIFPLPAGPGSDDDVEEEDEAEEGEE